VPPDGAALAAALAELGPRAAAVILEPLVQGAAGMRVHGPELLRAARRACDAHGVFLIADEVMTGFGRTGTLFACQQAGVAPDLLCLSKGLTNGMLPLAATLATARVFEAFQSRTGRRFFPHGHTFTANPIGCALALASLELALETRVWERFAALGARLEGALAPLRDHPRVRGLRRLGGIVAFDLEPAPGAAGGYGSETSARLRAAAVERGVLLRPLGDTLYGMPPACTSDEQLDAIARCLAALAE
jgi:adenosylmethionine-8-amino-7-oxononanoate aminotransferase